MFGATLMASGFYYRTPLPIQPMKAIGAAAIAGGNYPGSAFWLRPNNGIVLATGWGSTGVSPGPISKLATKPVVRGIMLGLGLSFMVDGVHRMATSPFLAGFALVVTYLLLTNPKVPAHVHAADYRYRRRRSL